jgi:hypothetical protein
MRNSNTSPPFEAASKALRSLLITDFFMLQRVNPLVPRKLQNLEPTDLPVGALNKEGFATFDTTFQGERLNIEL